MPKFIHSNMVGAPVMGTGVGAGLSVLDAVLRTGFNVRTPSSVTVTGGVATITYLAAHGYEDLSWLRVAGAGAAVLNADLQCTVPNSTTLTVPAPGVPNGPVSGTIETRVAPLGWERPFSGTNQAVYRSPNILGTRMFYQFDDTNLVGSTLMRIRGFESMSGVSAGVDPFPTTAQLANGTAIVKGASTPWAVVGDDRTVYLYTGSIPQGANYHGVIPFGDFLSYKPADIYAAVVGGSNATNGGADLAHCNGSAVHHVARSSNALVKSQLSGSSGPNPGISGQNGRPYPSVVHGGATFVRGLHILDGGTNTAVRGEWRGLMFVHEAIPATPWVVIPVVTGVSGRVVVMACGSASIGVTADEDWA